MATEASLRLAFARIGEASAADADDALETALKACRTTGWGCDELCAQWEKHKLNTEPHAALTAKSLEGLVAAWDAARGTKRPADGDAPAEKKPRVIDVELAKPPPPTVTKANAKDLKSLPMDGAADATPPDAFDLNKAAQMAFVSPSPAKPAETECAFPPPLGVPRPPRPHRPLPPPPPQPPTPPTRRRTCRSLTARPPRRCRSARSRRRPRPP